MLGNNGVCHDGGGKQEASVDSNGIYRLRIKHRHTPENGGGTCRYPLETRYW